MKFGKGMVGFCALGMFHAAGAGADSFRAGDVVYGNNARHDLVGRVAAVYRSPCRAEVDWDLMDGKPYSGAPSVWGCENLARQERCARDFCAGDRVHGKNDTHDLVGRVNRVFENGKAEVRWTTASGRPAPREWGYAYWTDRNLSPEDTRCRGPLCAGVTVHGKNSTHDLRGRVRSIFLNGVAEVDWEYAAGRPAPREWGFAYWRESSLSHEVRCIGRVCAGYGVHGQNSAGTLEGGANKVFANGQVEVLWERLNGRPAPREWGYAYWDERNLGTHGGRR